MLANAITYRLTSEAQDRVTELQSSELVLAGRGSVVETNATAVQGAIDEIGVVIVGLLFWFSSTKIECGKRG